MKTDNTHDFYAPFAHPILYRMLPRALRNWIQGREISMRLAAITSRNHRAIADFWSTVAGGSTIARAGYDEQATQELVKRWGEFMATVAKNESHHAEPIPNQIMKLVEQGADPNAVDVRDLFNPIRPKHGYGPLTYVGLPVRDACVGTFETTVACFPIPTDALSCGPYVSIGRLLKGFAEHGYSFGDVLLSNLAEHFGSRSRLVMASTMRSARDKAVEFADYHTGFARACRMAVDDPLGVHGGSKSDRVRWQAMLNA